MSNNYNDDLYWLAFNPEIEIFQDYVRSMESFLDMESQKHNESIELIDEKISSGKLKPILNDSTQIPAQMEYDFYRLQMIEYFSNILWKSCFVSLYTYLESSLLQRCYWEKNKVDTLLTPSDISGTGIDRAMTYLTKVQHINFSRATSAEWKDLQEYRKLRNCIVHNEGKLEERSEQARKLERYITSKASLSLSEGAFTEVVLSKAFCEEVLDTIARFLFALDKTSKT